MARSMRLFLIRHGETVDNVAGLYAGVRDSELTNHGFQQATRLGVHFQKMGLSFTHLFSSHLQRAAKTAAKIREAQLRPAGKSDAATAVPEVVQLPLLVEQSFGSMEGKKFHERLPEAKTTGKKHHRPESKSTEAFVDVESKDAMAERADTFLDTHLLPLLDDAEGDAERCIAIVSHGIFLSALWKRLLLRLPAKSVALSPELQAHAHASLEHLGGWSNTGYLELHVVQVHSATSDTPLSTAGPVTPVLEPSSSPAETLATNGVMGKVEVPLQFSDNGKVAQRAFSRAPTTTSPPTLRPTSPRIAHGWTVTILAINCKDHLKGFKRTGGGVGSSRHDASQKSIDTFFKRRKLP
ncbi:histidine phosphatase superfamily [Ampelomyces quisqualis]|uniref:Histidine phosphatase superfamily n=1 Tax=Ampelomyces quisqualis TaxID=50730 RepID=A0A6A5QRC2_AMPQU|nr:histidine phosphatase superfamily [Ampelomyces quisqualis]